MDALATVWMERAGISPADFAVNHPAGMLGRRLTLLVADLMVPAQAHPHGATWVHADGDLRRFVQMATVHPITEAPQTLAAEALALMERNPRQSISVLPVVPPDHPWLLQGLLRPHDLVQAGLGPVER